MAEEQSSRTLIVLKTWEAGTEGYPDPLRWISSSGGLHESLPGCSEAARAGSWAAVIYCDSCRNTFDLRTLSEEWQIKLGLRRRAGLTTNFDIILKGKEITNLQLRGDEEKLKRRA
jgi:hypothetical protein